MRPSPNQASGRDDQVVRHRTRLRPVSGASAEVLGDEAQPSRPLAGTAALHQLPAGKPVPRRRRRPREHRGHGLDDVGGTRILQAGHGRARSWASSLAATAGVSPRTSLRTSASASAIPASASVSTSRRARRAASGSRSARSSSQVRGAGSVLGRGVGPRLHALGRPTTHVSGVTPHPRAAPRAGTWRPAGLAHRLPRPWQRPASRTGRSSGRDRARPARPRP